MRTTISEVVVCVALVELPQQSLPKHAKVIRNTFRMSFQKLQEFHEPVFDRPQDTRLESVRRPAFRQVPA
jgi:hypothetical protein